MMGQITLTVCILTYLREQMLEDLLRSALSTRPHDLSVDVVVVDTSGIKSAESVINNLQVEAKNHPSIQYIGMESRSTIPEGRNVAMENASGDWIFFIDDDQLLNSDTLKLIAARLQTLDDDVAACKLGLNVSYQNTGHELCGLSTFETSPPYADGCRMPGDAMSTDGVLIKRSVVLDSGIQYDSKWSKDGGEDNDFFIRLKRTGCVFLSWTAITITDRVMLDRMNLTYCKRDALRKGLCRSQLEVETLKKSKVSVLLKSLFLLAVSIVLILPAAFRGRLAIIESRLLLLRQIGKIRGLLGGEVNMYQKPSNIT